MRNLLISLTFIFALIIFNSTDVFSQSPGERGGGSMVDIFGRSFFVNVDGFNLNPDLRQKIVVEVSEGRNGDPFIRNEYEYNSNQSINIEPTEEEEVILQGGDYYIKVYFIDIIFGKFHEEY